MLRTTTTQAPLFIQLDVLKAIQRNLILIPGSIPYVKQKKKQIRTNQDKRRKKETLIQFRNKTDHTASTTRPVIGTDCIFVLRCGSV